nr:NAD-dependent epimerase/dehydratase family protein [Paenisporosarcina sp. TG-14]
MLNSFIPYITQVSVGKRSQVNVFGGDYQTGDGTSVRDYIHVVDLANGHLKALENLQFINRIAAFNLGTGKGYSVLKVIETFQRINNTKIPYEIVERRSGEAAECYSAIKSLGWKAEKTLEDMCRDAWRWQEKNPNGYEN